MSSRKCMEVFYPKVRYADLIVPGFFPVYRTNEHAFLTCPYYYINST